MGYRERRERRAERREEWADKRRAKCEQAFDSAAELADAIPLGQPILVGHHSEGRARRDQERIHNRMSAGVEHGKMADHHDQAATTIRRQLDTSIYRDDHDELQRLDAKLADLEGKRDRIKAINAWIRRHRKAHGITRSSIPFGAAAELEERAARLLAAAATDTGLKLTDRERSDLLSAWQHNRHVGYPAYHLQNLGGTIARVKARIPAAIARKTNRARVQETLTNEVRA